MKSLTGPLTSVQDPRPFPPLSASKVLWPKSSFKVGAEAPELFRSLVLSTPRPLNLLLFWAALQKRTSWAWQNQLLEVNLPSWWKQEIPHICCPQTEDFTIKLEVVLQNPKLGTAKGRPSETSIQALALLFFPTSGWLALFLGMPRGKCPLSTSPSIIAPPFRIRQGSRASAPFQGPGNGTWLVGLS